MLLSKGEKNSVWTCFRALSVPRIINSELSSFKFTYFCSSSYLAQSCAVPCVQEHLASPKSASVFLCGKLSSTLVEINIVQLYSITSRPTGCAFDFDMLMQQVLNKLTFVFDQFLPKQLGELQRCFDMHMVQMIHFFKGYCGQFSGVHRASIVDL